MAVLHPDLAADHSPSPHNMLRYAAASNATPAAPLPPGTLNPMLVLASFYGYSELVASLLERGAQVNACAAMGNPCWCQETPICHRFI